MREHKARPDTPQGHAFLLGMHVIHTNRASMYRHSLDNVTGPMEVSCLTGRAVVALMIIPTLDTSANRQLPLSTRSSDWLHSLGLDTFLRFVLALGICHPHTLIHDDIIAEFGRNVVNSISNIDENLVIHHRSMEGSRSRTLRSNVGTKTPLATSSISAGAWYLYGDSRFHRPGSCMGSHRLA
jgi:hypothetical protein